MRLHIARADDPTAGADMLLNTQPATTAWYAGYSVTLLAVEPDLQQFPHPGKADYTVSIRLLLI